MRARFTRARTLAAATTGALAMALAACGGGTGADQAGGGSASGSGAKVTGIKLVAAEYSKDNTKKFWDAFAAEYKKRTGYDLQVQIVSWDSIDQQSSTMIQNNQAPDVLNLNAFAAYARDGLLRSADEVLPASVRSDILPAFVRSGSQGGRFYGFPDLASVRALFTNTELLKKAGVAAPPRTWAELDAAAKKVAALPGDEAGYAMPLGPEESQAEMSMWMFGNGGEWKNGSTWTIDSAKNVETLTHLKQMAASGLTQPNPARTNRADAFDLFRAGKAGMVVGFSPLAADLDKAGKVKYQVSPFPGKDGSASQPYAVTDYLMAFKKPGNEDALRKFYELYYSPDQVNTFIKAEGFLPVTTSGLQAFRSDPKLKVYLDTLPKARLTPTDDPAWDRVKLAVQQNLGSAVTPSGDPKAVLTRLQGVAAGG